MCFVFTFSFFFPYISLPRIIRSVYSIYIWMHFKEFNNYNVLPGSWLAGCYCLFYFLFFKNGNLSVQLSITSTDKLNTNTLLPLFYYPRIREANDFIFPICVTNTQIRFGSIFKRSIELISHQFASSLFGEFVKFLILCVFQQSLPRTLKINGLSNLRRNE